MESFRVQLSRELVGFEKLFCLYGNWVTIAHVAHLSGDASLLLNNADHVIRQLLKRHPRLRSRVRIHRDQVDSLNQTCLFETLEYDNVFTSIDVLKHFYEIRHTHDVNEWKKLTEEECNRNPYDPTLSLIFPVFRFLFVLNTHDHHEFQLILFSNHCATDGESGYIIINDFLSLAKSPVDQEPSSENTSENDICRR
ncbi:unnamed protein product [Didymodactylos carnosus]|uniref:Condensation domain-containing protein n=1 Tax=Didymodactylos carnosus TaxID=1234261 RepID=A0A815J2Q1_9BILA|nr:unnamed protein product [Didymodactylos carnosus]CAF4260289.1 unnamed protein product [Didymodactylos carnosus]